MDLAVTQRPAWLVPTPGQPEQTYLAEKLGEEGQYPWCTQEEFQLAEVLEAYGIDA
jgi:hypothetical protein